MTTIEVSMVIDKLTSHIIAMKHEGARLTEGEWSLLLMLEDTVAVLAALHKRLQVHSVEISRMIGDGK